MTENMEERPEDALRRIAGQCLELQAKLDRYREAIELWDALNMKENQQATQVLMIAKVVDFEKKGGPMITASVSDGVDWVDEWGLIAAWQAISYAQKEYEEGEDGD